MIARAAPYGPTLRGACRVGPARTRRDLRVCGSVGLWVYESVADSARGSPLLTPGLIVLGESLLER